MTIPAALMCIGLLAFPPLPGPAATRTPPPALELCGGHPQQRGSRGAGDEHRDAGEEPRVPERERPREDLETARGDRAAHGDDVGHVTSTIPARAEPGEAEPQERDAEGRAGEDAAPLITDRPDFTESAAVVKPGRYQAEFGYTYSRLDRLDSHAVGELLLRIPAHRRLELRFGLNSYTFVDGPGTDDSGLEDSSVGVKWKLVDGDPDLGLDRPDVAVIGSTSLPTGDDRFGEDELQPGVTLAVEWDLTERVALGSNVTLSSAVSGDERFGQVSGSVAVGTSVTDRAGAYVEYFGFSEESPDGPSLHFVNGGLTYLLSPDFQLDARIGAGLNGRDDDIFTGFGAAWRW